MTARTKSALVLAATLLIGMILGALLFGAVQRHRFENALRLARPDRFAASVEQIVRPVDAEQRRALRRVLEAFHVQMRSNRVEAAERMRAQLDSLQTRLSALLDDDQMARLQEHVRRHRRVLRRGPGRRPPLRPPPPPHAP